MLCTTCLLARSLHSHYSFASRQHPKTADSLLAFGQLLHDKGQFEDAMDLYRRALGVHAAAAASGRHDIAGATTDTGPGADAAACIACIGDAHVARGRTEHALAAYECAEAVALEALGAAHATVVFLGSKVANALFQLGHLDAATALYANMLLRCKVPIPKAAEAAVAVAAKQAYANPAAALLLKRKPPPYTAFLPHDADPEGGGNGAEPSGDSVDSNGGSGGADANAGAADGALPPWASFEESLSLSQSLMHQIDEAGKTWKGGSPVKQRHSPHHREVHSPPRSALRDPHAGAKHAHVRFDGNGDGEGNTSGSTARRLAWEDDDSAGAGAGAGAGNASRVDDGSDDRSDDGSGSAGSVHTVESDFSFGDSDDEEMVWAATKAPNTVNASCATQALLLNNLGNALRMRVDRSGGAGAALACYGRSLELYTQAYGAEYFVLATVYTNIGACCVGWARQTLPRLSPMHACLLVRYLRTQAMYT